MVQLKRFARYAALRTTDAPRVGRPNSAIMQEDIDRVARIIKESPRMGIRSISEFIHLSYGTLFSLLHEHLLMKKMYAKWVPNKLTEGQIETRVRVARNFLRDFKTKFDEKKLFLVTSDETWVPFEGSETVENTREWRVQGSSRPEIPCISPRSEKVMLTAWWDAQGVIMLDFWKKK